MRADEGPEESRTKLIPARYGLIYKPVPTSYYSVDDLADNVRCDKTSDQWVRHFVKGPAELTKQSCASIESKTLLTT